MCTHPIFELKVVAETCRLNRRRQIVHCKGLALRITGQQCGRGTGRWGQGEFQPWCHYPLGDGISKSDLIEAHPHIIGTPLTVPNAFFFSFSPFFGLESSYGSGAYSSLENGGNTDFVIICLPL